MKYWLRVGVQASASASDVNSETPTVIAKARKNTPVTPVVAIRGTKTTIGVMVENDQRSADFLQRAANGLQAVLSSVAMQGNIFDDHDGIVDDQSHGRRQAAQGHQVEALVEELERDKRDSTVAGMTSTATIEAPQSRRKSTMMSEASMMPIRMASRTLLMDSVTISDWS